MSENNYFKPLKTPSKVDIMSCSIEPQKDKVTKYHKLITFVFFILIGIVLYLKNPKVGANCLKSGVTELTNFFTGSIISGMFTSFFFAGAIVTFISRDLIAKIIGKNSNKLVSYLFASITGYFVSVCACGIIPVFRAIYKKGASIGPASTFLFASPAINLVAAFYTYSYINPKMAYARTIYVFVLSILIGIIMSLFFKNENEELKDRVINRDEKRSLYRIFIFFILMIMIMFLSSFPNEWYKGLEKVPIFSYIYHIFLVIIPKIYKGASFVLIMFLLKWFIVANLILTIIILSLKWFTKDELRLWMHESYVHFVKLMPRIAIGIFITGTLKVLVPTEYIITAVGSNSIADNFVASLIGAILYFGTIMGVTITKFFVEVGMHQGPALTLLLAGPIITLPSIISINSIIGTKKNVLYTILVILFSAIAGYSYGYFFIK